MPIALASDHAGFKLKNRVKSFLESLHIEYHDFGTFKQEAVDYPDYGAVAARSISQGKYERGILICGSGIGMSIVANKFKGVRAALCTSVQMADYARRHNDANILVLGGRISTEAEALKIVKTWLNTPFEGGRHLKRIQKIQKLTGL